MLIPNLSVLLAERRLTLSRVAQDTGISRTTLTALTGRSAKGIQFDTLNTLCKYLKVTPDALFIYRPFDLSLTVEGQPGRSDVVFTVVWADGDVESFRMLCDAEFRFAPASPQRPAEARPASEARPTSETRFPSLEALRLRLTLPDAPEETDRNRRLTSLLRALPGSVLTDLERDILTAFDRNIDPSLAPNDYSPALLWPWDDPFVTTQRPHV